MATNELPSQIEFLQFHIPGLPGGDYTIDVEQTVTTNNERHPAFTAQLSFSIASNRIALKPTDVQAVFPPDGSLLDHSNILPHIILNRSTMPWERRAYANDREMPWLALLLFEEGEITQSTMKLNKFNGFTLAYGESPDEYVTVIDIPKALAGCLPTGKDLKLLSHVRRGKDTSGEETAVIIGNRIPAKGVKSTVHLVNLEGWYKKNGQGEVVFDPVTHPIQLISLKSWSFFCLRTYLLTAASVKNLTGKIPQEDLDLLVPLYDTEITGHDAFLDKVRSKLGKDAPDSYRDILLKAAEWKKSFRDVVVKLESGVLQLPSKDAAKTYLDAGFVPLPHQFRSGRQLVSWYHGPLLPGKNSGDWAGPVRAADALLRYYPSTGLLDVSYAAAWELGRLLALSSKAFSVGLYNWKRRQAQQTLKGQYNDVHAYPLELPAGDANEQNGTPPAVTDWFSAVGLLNYIPPNYIVPDEALLPVESIRFFQVDPLWMDCLFDGAFSIGRVIGQDLEMEKQLEGPFRFPYRSQGLSGVLIRSEVVAGWPGLHIEGYTVKGGNSVQQPVQRKYLSKNVLLCLFDGELHALDLSLKPETMHFGLDESDTTDDALVKRLRKADGSADGLVIDPLPWQDQTLRVLNMHNLAVTIKSLEKESKDINAAWFALEMIESSVKVRFTAK